MSENFFAISNDELKTLPKAGEFVICRQCHEQHRIEFAKDKDGNITETIGYYKCGDQTFLASIDGHLLS